MSPLSAFYKSPNRDFTLLNGNSFELLPQFNFQFDAIFADPPYFLSNGGISVHAGKIVSVNKGAWDEGGTFASINDFNLKWLFLCREKLKDSGSIWISGTYHNIFSVSNALNALGFKILNVITWIKSNPPPNISCRYFTHSTEFVIWARKYQKVPHYFNYELMKKLNGGHQMTDVWRMPAIAPWEKTFGKHPTQKPLALLCRILLASTPERGWVLDPFAGSSSTGIAANLANRRYLGIEKETEFAQIGANRRQALEQDGIRAKWTSRLKDLEAASSSDLCICAKDSIDYGLPF